jgi:hypothetical protein
MMGNRPEGLMRKVEEEEIKGNEMGWACGARGRKKSMHQLSRRA